jgi:hypothetical protein
MASSMILFFAGRVDVGQLPLDRGHLDLAVEVGLVLLELFLFLLDLQVELVHLGLLDTQALGQVGAGQPDDDLVLLDHGVLRRHPGDGLEAPAAFGRNDDGRRYGGLQLAEGRDDDLEVRLADLQDGHGRLLRPAAPGGERRGQDERGDDPPGLHRPASPAPPRITTLSFSFRPLRTSAIPADRAPMVTGVRSLEKVPFFQTAILFS